MNSVMERWIGSCRRELLDRTLVWNQRHLMTTLREFGHGTGVLGPGGERGIRPSERMVLSRELVGGSCHSGDGEVSVIVSRCSPSKALTRPSRSRTVTVRAE